MMRIYLVISVMFLLSLDSKPGLGCVSELASMRAYGSVGSAPVLSVEGWW